MQAALRLIKALPLVLAAPFLVVAGIITVAIADLLSWLRPHRKPPSDRQPSTNSASIVIPNWNGRDLLAQYLPSVIAATRFNPSNEVIVVDNGSEDGSAEFVRENFPTVRVIPLKTNLGFGGGSNIGFQAATNDIVVLLNSDMRVDRDFLAPLLRGFTDERVFAVSCQIFFSDPAKTRQETGLTQAWWANGRLGVRHRIDDAVTDLFPCFYGGGGSCAFDRLKFLELGGFDPLLSPFYLEDTDLGYMAWKRGWKVLYQPQSIVYHEHRGTIGRKFSQQYIDSILKKNFILFVWKNIHDARWLAAHFLRVFADGVLSAIFGASPERYTVQGLIRATAQFAQIVRSRHRARSLAVIDDKEAFRRPLGGYFRDRFQIAHGVPERLNVLFVSPYTICPPVHGGAVFMYQTCTYLARLANLHLIVLIDHPHEADAHEELAAGCVSAEFLLRMKGAPHPIASIEPHAIAEYRNGDLEWLIHRQLYTKAIDVLQLEYLPMGQYAGRFHRIVSILFEHDVYFQSIGRQWPNMRGMRQIKASLEYLRALHYELNLLPKLDRVQVCTDANSSYLVSYRPELRPKIDDNLRAGIDTSRYSYIEDSREPLTMLFLGSFRHLPNAEALDWFVRRVLPLIHSKRPEARLIVIGSDPPPRHSLPGPPGAIELHGFVEDIMTPLNRYAIFVCPILSGSGVRVKLLEAFAAGIPVVSTRIGAEGLTSGPAPVCRLADTPEEFAAAVLSLFDEPQAAAELARNARRHVEEHFDMAVLTQNLESSYRRAINAKQSEAPGVSRPD